MKNMQNGRCAPARRGFTLVEAIVVIVILGLMATVVAPRIMQYMSRGKEATAAASAAGLATAVRALMADTGGLPPPGSSITILWERPSDMEAGSWRGPYVNNRESLIDPWGRPFILRIPGEKNVDFDIVSYGKDGKPGGEDEDADIIKP